MSEPTYWQLGEQIEGGPGHVFRIAYVDDQDPRYALVEYVGQNTGQGTVQPTEKPFFDTVFRNEELAGTGDWVDPREGVDDRIIYKLDEGVELLKVVIALAWRDERCEVSINNGREKGYVSHVYNNFFGALCVHVKHWDGKLSGSVFKLVKLERRG